MKHIRNINGKNYELDVTTLKIEAAGYGGFYGSNFDVTVLIKCNSKQSEFCVTLDYPAG